MQKAIIDIWNYILTYTGNGPESERFGLLWIIALISFGLVCFYSKKKPVAAFLMWFTIIVTVALFNPGTYLILSKVKLDDVYWRMMWIIPYTPVMAYSVVILTDLIPTDKKGYKWAVFGVVAVFAVAVMLCGRLMYIERDYDWSKNVYKVPDDVPQVAELIVEGSKITGEDNVVEWIRVVDPSIKLPYGRQDLHFSATKRQEELMQLIHAEVWDAEALSAAVIDYKCDYIVASVDREINGSLEDYGFYPESKTEMYVVYKYVGAK